MKTSTLVVLNCILVMSTSHAALITTADGQGADTIVVGGTNADINYGSNPTLLLKNVSPVNGFTRKNYLRFDLSSVSGSIESASLDLVINDNNNGTVGVPSSFNVAVFGLIEGAAGQDWSESTITWNNAPGNANSGSSFDSEMTIFLGSLEVTTSDVAGSTVSFSSPSLVSLLTADADNLLTLMLARTDTRVGENLGFMSKEYDAGQYAPSLSITAIPEPDSAILFAMMVGVGALCIRRRLPRAASRPA